MEMSTAEFNLRFQFRFFEEFGDQLKIQSIDQGLAHRGVIPKCESATHVHVYRRERAEAIELLCIMC